MAEQVTVEPKAVQPDAGLVFRVQMWMSHYFLGYWKHMVAVVVAVLFGVLIYGQYSSWYEGNQKSTSQSVARAELSIYRDLILTLPEDQRASARDSLPDLTSLLLSVPMGAAQKTPLLAGGEALWTIAQGSSGTASVEAAMSAAELFRLAGDPAKQREALSFAAKDASGALRFGAEGGLATLDLAEGRGEAAIVRLSSLAQGLDGYLAEQTMLDLAGVQTHLGKNAEARATYEAFLQRFPTSSRADQARKQLETLGVTP